MRRLRFDREGRREANRALLPVLFWVMAFVAHELFAQLVALAPWVRYVQWATIALLVGIGLYFVPRAVRTFRDL